MRAYLLALLMLAVSLSGCINDESTNASGIGDTTEDELALPDWQIGDQWLYTFITPQFGKTAPAWWLLMSEKMMASSCLEYHLRPRLKDMQ